MTTLRSARPVPVAPTTRRAPATTAERPASIPPILASGDVHVWRLPLDAPPATRDVLARALSSDERQRASRGRAGARPRASPSRSGLRARS